ncbi:hypothetical protein DXT99_23245 [Pontibacter diazotrophicus]|uniref:Uncharacterized protein n=1 Tax=Pontibacter diazotrophicus TaxID=1400979 RepID=A0A3D8L3E5_9BACT|nr:hypothetical protein DXT99_23245 [Pontibacter diazotrophicus]
MFFSKGTCLPRVIPLQINGKLVKAIPGKMCRRKERRQATPAQEKASDKVPAKLNIDYCMYACKLYPLDNLSQVESQRFTGEFFQAATASIQM